MSKAFTSESDALQAPLGLLPTGRRPITQVGLARFQQELRQLLEVERPALLAGAAQNDAGARNRLQAVEWRIQVLTRQLTLSDVIFVPHAKPTTVSAGTRVRVRDEDGSERSYSIVGPDEIDAGRGQISHASPIARALMGLKVGAWASIHRPAGVREVKILSIEAV